MSIPDLTDSFVRDMCERDHFPVELWNAFGELVRVNCRTCGIIWPCPTRKALNEIPIHGTVETHATVEMISMPVSEWKALVKSYDELANDLAALKRRMQEIREEIKNNELRKGHK
jgi:hypothetical protein